MCVFETAERCGPCRTGPGIRRQRRAAPDQRRAASLLAREQHCTARAAFDADDRILALDAGVVGGMGSGYPFAPRVHGVAREGKHPEGSSGLR
ncbi:hypothetical protein ELQ87_00275 [Streptomyces griseoviridis]|uniref:Uncharacterized protein n=1 Tax=Streptomyces griseoviridis TaxID=45398 RepID=A0A3S9Z567_STRGD|nr:hypothetical protein ELQ87_00275 [Streptomyces griseoviridis]QCN90243.1 hypothetical protein DDJ31_39085 [Streptomyces griseoviridis]